MNAKVEIRDNTEAISDLFGGWNYLRKSEVLVGIPKERNASHGGITNAELLYIHSNGSPANGIPARPTIEPGIQDPKSRPVIQTLLGEAMKAAITGNISGAQLAQKKAGQVAVNAAKAVFGSASLKRLKGNIRRIRTSKVYTSDDFSPISGISLVGKHVWKVQHNPAPLVNTGALRNAVTFVIRVNGR